jgi:uncharacterized protein YecE (DUF72 family)
MSTSNRSLQNKAHVINGTIHFGTSGWTYDHWKGIFYPDTLAKNRWFEYYCEHFSTVELNASFYRIPTHKTVESWKQRSPEHFDFSIKMSRFVSHVKKLKNCERELEWFFSVFEPLSMKIALYLVQIPPALRFDPERIVNFSKNVPRKVNIAFEFRNTSWYRNETVELLRELGFAFCIHDMAGIATDKIVTSPFIYIRFHGFDSPYGGDYPDSSLQSWADWIKDQAKHGKHIYCYFNNDIGGFAIKNCQRLNAMVGCNLNHPEMPG